MRFAFLGALATLAACSGQTDSAFDLVAYQRGADGRLGAFVLDTGLTAEDCADALRLPSGWTLVTCEPINRA